MELACTRHFSLNIVADLCFHHTRDAVIVSHSTAVHFHDEIFDRLDVHAMNATQPHHLVDDDFDYRRDCHRHDMAIHLVQSFVTDLQAVAVVYFALPMDGDGHYDVSVAAMIL